MRRGQTLTPRAVGRRLPFGSLPAFVSDWVRARLGEVTVVREHVGGMSPGCATTVASRDGRRFFVKAVGRDLNAGTVGLFRKEAHILQVLNDVPYRPRLEAWVELQDWIVLLLEHVEGRFPDMRNGADVHQVAEVLRAQSEELSPPPADLTVGTLADNAEKWTNRWDLLLADPTAFLPAWAVRGLPDLDGRVRSLPGRLEATTLCHTDVRDDNYLVRANGAAVVLDWGSGPRWLDLGLLAVQLPTPMLADQMLREWLSPEQQDVITDLCVAFGGSQAWKAQQPQEPSLPSMATYCREDASRFLRLAEVRLLSGA